jgi:hypothetical protein
MGVATLHSPLSPVLGGEGPGVRGRGVTQHAPSPLTPLPRFGGEGHRRVAKGILYARRGVTFPPDGPWSHAPNDFADLPHPYSTIEAGHPILTLFASDAEALRRRAAEVEALLYAGP